MIAGATLSTEAASVATLFVSPPTPPAPPPTPPTTGTETERGHARHTHQVRTVQQWIQYHYTPLVLDDHRQNRHQALLMLFFYIMLVGVVVKLWIFSKAIHSTILVAISAILTAILVGIFVYRLYYVVKAWREGRLFGDDEERERDRDRDRDSRGERDVERGDVRAAVPVPPGLRPDQQVMVRMPDGSPFFLGRSPSGNWILAHVSEVHTLSTEEWVNRSMDALHTFVYGERDSERERGRERDRLRERERDSDQKIPRERKRERGTVTVSRPPITTSSTTSTTSAGGIALLDVLQSNTTTTSVVRHSSAEDEDDEELVGIALTPSLLPRGHSSSHSLLSTSRVSPSLPPMTSPSSPPVMCVHTHTESSCTVKVHPSPATTDCTTGVPPLSRQSSASSVSLSSPNRSRSASPSLFTALGVGIAGLSRSGSRSRVSPSMEDMTNLFPVSPSDGERDRETVARDVDAHITDWYIDDDDEEVHEVEEEVSPVERVANCCAICLEDYTEVDVCVRLTHCPHVFHKQCLSMWIGRQNSCPLCKQMVSTVPR